MSSSNHHDKIRGEQPWMHGLAGVLGSSTASMIFYPLDFLRTRMHILHQGLRTMPLRSAREIVQQEGLKGMYKGMTVSVISTSLGWGLYLLTFRTAQEYVTEVMEQVYGNEKLEDLSWGSSGRDFLSACAAATLTGAIITPLHVIKTRRQLEDVNRNLRHGLPTTRLPSGLAGVRYIVKNEGWRAMFRGLGPQILLTGNTTIQVTLYECFRRNLFTDHEDPSSMQVALASGVSKAVASMLFNPLEVVRTRLQDRRNAGSVAYRGMWSGLKAIYVSEGVRGLYRGMPVNVARVIPSTVLAFVLYEKCLWAIRSTHQHVSARTFYYGAGTAASAPVQPTI